MDLRAKQCIQQHIAVVAKVIVSAHGRGREDQLAGQAVTGRHGRGQPCMIGLKTAPGHQRVGAFGQCFTQQKLQFAQLVATTTEPGEVIAFDIEVATIEFWQLAKAGQFLDRCRAFKQGRPWIGSQCSIKMIHVVGHGGSLVE
ncbi:hypothetical protein D3C86_1282350 [compost metagenome]